MFKFATAPQAIIPNIRDAFRLYKFTIKRVWPWQLLWLLPTLVSYFIQGHGNLTYLASNPNAPADTTLTIELYVYSFVMLIIALYGACFVIKRIYDLGTTNTNDVRATFKNANSRILSVIGGYFLNVVLIFLSISLLTLVGLFLIWIVGKFVALGNTMTVAFIVGAILFMIYVSLLVVFFLPLILLDHYKIRESIVLSIKLVYGNWWDTFLVFLVPGLLSFFCLLIGSLIAGLTVQNPFATNLTMVFLLTFLYPLLFSTLLVLYNDLKLRQIIPPQEVVPTPS
ncbi:MAG: hypothetical protein QM752_06950 [Gammaproteobacteria bacterium]